MRLWECGRSSLRRKPIDAVFKRGEFFEAGISYVGIWWLVEDYQAVPQSIGCFLAPFALFSGCPDSKVFHTPYVPMTMRHEPDRRSKGRKGMENGVGRFSRNGLGKRGAGGSPASPPPKYCKGSNLKKRCDIREPNLTQHG